MKVIHVCLSCFYIDNYRYQENELVRAHVADGHEVLVVASTESYVDNLSLGYVAAGEYMGSDGAKVIRLPYIGPVPFILKKKLRIHHGVSKILRDFDPDVIMFHGLCGWELLTVASYKRAKPLVRLYVDSHEDANNSAVGKLSQILHKYYYRPIIRRALPWIDKVLCISLETIDFCKRQYGIPDQDMEFFPLGGYVADDDSYQSLRAQVRAELNLQEDHTAFLQSGKFDNKKKLVESLTAFAMTRSKKLRFLIVGRVHESIEQQVTQLASADSRVQYLGWKTADELYRLLCAVDVYVQPGSQSATMQMSICARCPVVIADVPSHEPFVKGNGWKVSSQTDLSNAFASIEENPSVLSEMSKRSLVIAHDLLEYRHMAKRLLV